MDYRFDKKAIVSAQSIDQTIKTYVESEEAETQFQSWKQFVAEEQREEGRWEAISQLLNERYKQTEEQKTTQQLYNQSQ